MPISVKENSHIDISVSITLLSVHRHIKSIITEAFYVSYRHSLYC